MRNTAINIRDATGKELGMRPEIDDKSTVRVDYVIKEIEKFIYVTGDKPQRNVIESFCSEYQAHQIFRGILNVVKWRKKGVRE
ncbi:hypothetical protein GLOIN_2v1660660 [Rhizophagus clarus]|uniref:Uncharacterized protein n=1 Tax=Rhizophagus clarus TaxID=94130 RepID=A0A8H3LFM6_9GLOM|nr:hypothetical protein GLOIN_2v1660660 [Rhizophagus clarus]